MPRARSVCSVNTPVPCGRPVTRDGRCDDHAIARDQARGSRQARGYGTAHDAARRALLAAWRADQARGVAWWCPRCRQPLRPGQAVDADHFRTRPPQPPDALSHAACNRGKII